MTRRHQDDSGGDSRIPLDRKQVKESNPGLHAGSASVYPITFIGPTEQSGYWKSKLREISLVVNHASDSQYSDTDIGRTDERKQTEKRKIDGLQLEGLVPDKGNPRRFVAGKGKGCGPLRFMGSFAKTTGRSLKQTLIICHFWSGRSFPLDMMPLDTHSLHKYVECQGRSWTCSYPCHPSEYAGGRSRLHRAEAKVTRCALLYFPSVCRAKQLKFDGLSAQIAANET
jgi:hypothetical protein